MDHTDNWQRKFRTFSLPSQNSHRGSFDEAHSPSHSHHLFIFPSFASPSFQPLPFDISLLLLSLDIPSRSTMKLSVSSFISNLTSKKHKSKKSRSISRQDAGSFDSTTSSSSDEYVSYQLQSTPKSVLQSSLNDVKISRHELETVLRRLCTDPPSDEEVSAIVAAGGVDGCITMADLGKICESDGEEELREAFKVFDANGDGKISAEELLEVFVAMGDDACTIEDCKRMIGGVDSDGDGLVCFGDFLKMMECQRC